MMITTSVTLVNQARRRRVSSRPRGPRPTRIIDRAIQVFGTAGLSGDTPLALFYAIARQLRIVDGPDEVHKRAIARIELRK